VIVTPGRLLRLYPPLWRSRYGDEFLALLEAAPITRAVVRDTVRAAAWEWIRWTRIGRVALAFAIAVPTAGAGRLLVHLWPGPMADLIHAHRSWIALGGVIVLSVLPWLIGIGLLSVTKPPHKGGPVPRFAVQVSVLALTSVVAQWLTTVDLPDLTPGQMFRGGWIGDGIYMSLFLIWLFNIEGGATGRYLRRLSRIDLV